ILLFLPFIATSLKLNCRVFKIPERFDPKITGSHNARPQKPDLNHPPLTKSFFYVLPRYAPCFNLLWVCSFFLP
ncbi:MAG: hypothetical protein PVJ50_10265, partial [Desulfobacterales bacterium]